MIVRAWAFPQSKLENINFKSDSEVQRASPITHELVTPAEESLAVDAIAQRNNVGPGRSAFGVRVALQLHTIAPSSPLSHSASDLQLPEFFISLQSLAPMQAHLTPSPGVWKQLNSALASILLESDAIVKVRTRRAIRISPST
jgi:hypothetical protein